MLELAARETRGWESLDASSKEDRLKAEEQTVYSEVFVYVNYLIYLLCPLDLGTAAGRRAKRMGEDFEAAASNSISNSMAESDSVDAESGFEDQVRMKSHKSILEKGSWCFTICFSSVVCKLNRIHDFFYRRFPTVASR